MSVEEGSIQHAATSPERPLTIAHRAGNHLSLLPDAFAAGVDYLEADIWLYRGRLEVRHEKTIKCLPVLWDRWLLKPGWTPRLLLGDLLAATADRGRLYLDLKGDADGLADAVAAAVATAKAKTTVAFSGGWRHLDRLAELVPDAPRFYTIGTPGRLDELRPRLQRREIAAVAIDSRFLTEEIVLELRGLGVATIVTWAVETPAVAARVLAWGVGGVTSDSLTLLAAIREGRIGSAVD